MYVIVPDPLQPDVDAVNVVDPATPVVGVTVAVPPVGGNNAIADPDV